MPFFTLAIDNFLKKEKQASDSSCLLTILIPKTVRIALKSKMNLVQTTVQKDESEQLVWVLLSLQIYQHWAHQGMTEQEFMSSVQGLIFTRL